MDSKQAQSDEIMVLKAMYPTELSAKEGPNNTELDISILVVSPPWISPNSGINLQL